MLSRVKATAALSTGISTAELLRVVQGARSLGRMPLHLFVKDSDPVVFYRRITRFAQERLVPGGALWFETHFRYAEDVLGILEQEGFRSVTLTMDLSGNPRFVHGLR